MFLRRPHLPRRCDSFAIRPYRCALRQKRQSKLHRRSVTLGEVGSEIEILAGLEEGDLVVTAGTRRLSDGMRVKLEGVGEEG